jgi:hypothetical protein
LARELVLLGNGGFFAGNVASQRGISVPGNGDFFAGNVAWRCGISGFTGNVLMVATS